MDYEPEIKQMETVKKTRVKTLDDKVLDVTESVNRCGYLYNIGDVRTFSEEEIIDVNTDSWSMEKILEFDKHFINYPPNTCDNLRLTEIDYKSQWMQNYLNCMSIDELDQLAGAASALENELLLKTLAMFYAQQIHEICENHNSQMPGELDLGAIQAIADFLKIKIDLTPDQQLQLHERFLASIGTDKPVEINDILENNFTVITPDSAINKINETDKTH